MEAKNIVEKILSDATSEGENTVATATAEAQAIVEKAQQNADLRLAEAKAIADKKAEEIKEKKSASARLECAKILLSKKHKVIDGIYEKALAGMVSLDKEQTLLLAERLLEENAEEEDEVFLAENFAYGDDLKNLAVIQEKKLKISKERLPLSGGLFLKGKISDKDLTYGTLLAADKQDHAGELISRLYR